MILSGATHRIQCPNLIDDIAFYLCDTFCIQVPTCSAGLISPWIALFISSICVSPACPLDLPTNSAMTIETDRIHRPMDGSRATYSYAKGRHNLAHRPTFDPRTQSSGLGRQRKPNGHPQDTSAGEETMSRPIGASRASGAAGNHARSLHANTHKPSETLTDRVNTPLRPIDDVLMEVDAAESK